MAQYLMGLDLGSTKGRCLLLNVESSEVLCVFRPWQHHMTAEMGYDLDTDKVWRLFGEAAREAMAKVNARPQDVLAVSTTGMRHGSVVVDARGDVLLAAPTRDARGAMQRRSVGGGTRAASFTSARGSFRRRCLRSPDYCGWRK